MVLKNCQRLLSYVGIISTPKVPSSIVICVCLFFYFVVLGPLLFYMFQDRASISYINSALYLAISAILFLLVYIDFMRSDIQQIIDRLELLTSKSKCKNSPSSETATEILKFTYSGIVANDDSFLIYDAAEQEDVSLTTKLFAYSIYFLISMTIPPALLPIMYAIIEFPDPKFWFLIYPARWERIFIIVCWKRFFVQLLDTFTVSKQMLFILKYFFIGTKFLYHLLFLFQRLYLHFIRKIFKLKNQNHTFHYLFNVIHPKLFVHSSNENRNSGA